MALQQPCLCRELDFNKLFFNDFLKYARFLQLVTDLEDDESTFDDDEISTISRARDGYLTDVPDLDAEHEHEAMCNFLTSIGYDSEFNPAIIERFIQQKLQAPLRDNSFVAYIGKVFEVEQRAKNCKVCASFLDTRLWRLSDQCDRPNAQGTHRDPVHVEASWLLYLVPIWPAWKTMQQGINEGPNELYVIPVPDASKCPLEVIDDGFYSYRQQRDLRTLCLLDHPQGLWRSMRAQIDWNQIRTWLPQFNPRKNLSETLGRPQSRYFMLMDVSNNCIVRVSTLDGTCFAALSYVWGSATILEPWCQRIQRFHDQVEYSTVPYDSKMLPKTIQGALQICNALQIPYLWIDSLCIAQNSRRDKAQAIADMGHVFAGSYICIIAATNSDIHAALPGVNMPRLVSKHDINGVTIGISPINPSDGVRKSVWSSRGWTFQEAMLPETSLVILQDQIFLQSARSLWCEYVDHNLGNVYESLSNDYQPEPLLTLALYSTDPNDKCTDHFAVYKDMVENYSKRNLKYQADAEKAFAGLSLTLAKTFKTTMSYALPINDFAGSMNWCREHNLIKMRARKGDDGNLLFPSYSWLSVVGAVNYFRLPSDASLHCQFFPRVLPQAQLQNRYPANGYENNFAVHQPLDQGWRILEGAIPMVTRLHAVDHKFLSAQADHKAYIDEIYKRRTILDDDETLPEGQFYALPVVYKDQEIMMALIVRIYLYPFATVADWPHPTPRTQSSPVSEQKPLFHRLTQAEMEENVYLARRVGIIPYAHFGYGLDFTSVPPMEQLVHLILA